MRWTCNPRQLLFTFKYSCQLIYPTYLEFFSSTQLNSKISTGVISVICPFIWLNIKLIYQIWSNRPIKVLSVYSRHHIPVIATAVPSVQWPLPWPWNYHIIYNTRAGSADYTWAYATKVLQRSILSWESPHCRDM